MFLNNRTYKKILWKRNQRHRDGWERKWNTLIRNVLNKQFKDLSHSIDITNFRDEGLPAKVMGRDAIEKFMEQLYISVGLAFAKEQFQGLKDESQSAMLKSDEPVDEWTAFMRNYAKTKAGYRITSIAESGREQALKIIRGKIEQSVTEGWGTDKTASAIKKGLIEEGQVINKWRALRIARTEIVTASNQGSLVGMRELDMPTDKYWIATHDERVRADHLAMEDQNPLDIDEPFIMSGIPMECPGDPDGEPEDTINCRCGIAYEIRGY